MTLLDAHITSLGTEVGALDAGRTDESHQRDVEDAMALWVSLSDRLEQASARKRAAAGGEWREEDARSLIPAYQHWYAGAMKTREHIRALRERGIRPQGMSEFMRAYLRARMMAVDFDTILASLQRLEDLDNSRARDAG